MREKEFGQHSGWRWKEKNMNLAKWKHLVETPVKWISKEKNTILTIRDDEWKEQRHNASERNNRRYIIGITEWRRKCQLLPQMSLESILAKKNWTELLENQQRKAQACSGLMENISKLWGDNRPLTETIACLRSTKRWKLLPPRW